MRTSAVALISICLWSGAGMLAAAPFQQDPGPDGIVSMEAENYDAAVDMPPNTWELVTTADGFTGTFSGAGAMQTLPHTPLGGTSYATNYAARSPRLDFEINFEQTGTYYVWILAYGPGPNSDSCHAGLDGEETATSETMSGWNAQYDWSGNQMAGTPSYFEVTDAGVHTLNIWMREDGLAIDKIVLTLNPDFSLTGDEPGPAESQRGPRVAASGASPADGATDVPRDVVLSWTPGVSTVARDVYFGTSFDDVNAASSDNPLGVLANAGQAATAYQPPARLEFGQTYYWRIDEIGGPPDSAVNRGSVWSFTTEPYAYPVQNITATASSNTDGQPPENTINGSGLDADDLHSMDSSAMWLTAMGAPEPAWIQYEFDRIYKLTEMWVWNYNVEFEVVLGYGFKDVTVETSTDGENWTVLTETEFAKAPSQPGYAHDTMVDMGGVPAKYVRLTAATNWSTVNLKQFGLSEVRFYYIPVHAREPQPASGQAGAGPDVVLSWRPGREAAVHDVYFSGNRQAVIDETALLGSVEDASYDLAGTDLDLGQLFYWKINEVNENEDPSLWAGDIWSFSTPEFLVVDDFEGYTNDSPDRVFQTWVDGLGFSADEFYPNGNPGNGSAAFVGHDIWSVGSPYYEGDIVETGIVHGGDQAMPLYYTNGGQPYYSETDRTFDTPQNWTTNGIDTLRLYFRGNPVGFLETSPGVITMSAAGIDIWDMSDEFTYAYKPLNGNGSITVRVDSVENTDVWAKAGLMIRDTLDPDAKNAMAYVTPDGRVGWQYRELTSGTSSSTRSDPGAITLPHWLRLTRTGDTIKAEHSADGVTWEPMVEAANPDEPSELAIGMRPSAFIGLALHSHVAGVNNTSEFSEASTSGGATGAWQFAEIGVDHLLNEPDDLYVALQDGAGRVGVVTYPGGVLIDEWTEWMIPMTDFSAAGVDLTRVAKMIIGVGDRTNPSATGSGIVFIDDIGVGHPGLVDPGDQGLVASYSLENSVEDGSGNGHDGTAVGDPPYVDGPAGYGMAIEFDGTGAQQVTLGTFNPSEATGQLSVALWAKWNGLNEQYQGLIAKRDAWAADSMMWHLEAHQTSGDIRVGREGISQIQTAAMTEGEWEHWAFTFDGAQVVIFRNGQEVTSGAFSFGSGTDATVRLGAVSDAGSNPYNGALDEIYIYDRPLAAFEVRYLAAER